MSMTIVDTSIFNHDPVKVTLVGLQSHFLSNRVPIEAEFYVGILLMCQTILFMSHDQNGFNAVKGVLKFLLVINVIHRGLYEHPSRSNLTPVVFDMTLTML